jgi:hypothetical protein
VDPFLRLFMPDLHVKLDEETLEITGIVRDGHEEPYESLSGSECPSVPRIHP